MPRRRRGDRARRGRKRRACRCDRARLGSAPRRSGLVLGAVLRLSRRPRTSVTRPLGARPCPRWRSGVSLYPNLISPGARGFDSRDTRDPPSVRRGRWSHAPPRVLACRPPDPSPTVNPRSRPTCRVRRSCRVAPVASPLCLAGSPRVWGSSPRCPPIRPSSCLLFRGGYTPRESAPPIIYVVRIL